MKKYLLLGLLVSLLIGRTSPAAAENKMWQDQNYDFKTVQSVFLEEPDYAEKIVDDIDRLRIRDVFFSTAAKLKDTRILTGALLPKTDDNAETALTALKERAGVTVKASIDRYEVQSIWQEPYTYTETEYKTTTITKDGKKTTIETPQQVIKYKPGCYISTAFVKVRFNVYSVKTGALVFAYTDERSAQKEPDGMYQRIVESFYDRLGKAIGRG